MYDQKWDENESNSYFEKGLPFPDNYNTRLKVIDRFIRSQDYIQRLHPSTRFDSSLRTVLGYIQENSLFFSLFIAFAIIVLNSWQTYIDKAIAFGASGPADAVAAVLFGFGSQTILTKGVEVAQKWTATRLKPESD